MGIVLGVEAAVGIAEAAEAAGTAAEVGEAAAGAGEAISAGAEAGSEAGTAAGTDAATAVSEGADSDAFALVISKLNEALAKVGKMVAEFVIIDRVFKVAEEILIFTTSDPHARAQKLQKLIEVLTKSSLLLTSLNKWLQENIDKETKVDDYVISIQGILSKFIPKLGAAAAVLQNLSSKVATQNNTNQPIAEGEIDVLQTGLKAVLDTYKSLVQFKSEHEAKIPKLSELPITEGDVAALQANMP